MTDLANVNGIEMPYIKFGNGKKVFVILPGISIKSLAVYSESIENQYSLLKEDYTVYLFERRKNYRDGYKIFDMAEDTVSVMKHFNIDKADICGVSQGGMIAMYIAVYHPEIANRIIIGSATAKNNKSLSANIDKWQKYAESYDIKALSESVADAIFSEQTLKQNRDLIVNSNLDATKAEIESLVMQTRATKDYDISGEIEKINCKALVIGSKGDKVCTPEESEYIAEKIGGELIMYGKEYGHAVYDEAPDYLRKIVDFLNATAENRIFI